MVVKERKNETKYHSKSKIGASEVRIKTKEFIQNIRNANVLVDILAHSESDDNAVLISCIKSFNKIFTHLIDEKEMYLEAIPESADGLDKISQFRFWLLARYSDCCEKLCQFLSSDNSNIKELALCTLMKFVEAEGKAPVKKLPSSHLSFPGKLFESIINELLSDEVDQAELISRFQEYLEYDDVRYNAMKYLHSKLKNCQERSDTFCCNVLSLLENVSMPDGPSDGDRLTHFLTPVPSDGRNLKINTYREHQKLFTSAWLDFLKGKLSTSLYKKVLVLLHDKVMPYMTSPLLLSDFLTQSYDIGGAISLLALNGIFILINKFNLDYPDFYQKLYALLEPSVFHAKYRARFFYLLDLFLSSTHLPSYLVAAFVKRLARLCLTAPPCGLTITIPFVYNLIMRHPSVKCLLHQPDGPTDLTCDPYVMDEPNPQKCHALNSSLWEIKSLEHHYHHTISADAKKMAQPQPKQEYDVAKLFDTTTSQMIHQEKKRKYNEVSVTFEPPKGLFGNHEDQLKDLWTLS